MRSVLLALVLVSACGPVSGPVDQVDQAYVDAKAEGQVWLDTCASAQGLSPNSNTISNVTILRLDAACDCFQFTNTQFLAGCTDRKTFYFTLPVSN